MPRHGDGPHNQVTNYIDFKFIENLDPPLVESPSLRHETTQFLNLFHSYLICQYFKMFPKKGLE